MSTFKNLVAKQKQHQHNKSHRFNLESITNANRNHFKCPCQSDKLYKDCCEPILTDLKLAKVPEQLMRSRYTAFVLGKIDYLMISHHKSTRPIKEKTEIALWAKSVTWTGLEIVNTQAISENEGFVTFKAFFVENGKEAVIYEKSRFLKENGFWTYIDGKHLK